MYKIYLILHFFLMLLWIIPASISVYQLLVHFKNEEKDEQISILKGIQTLSNKTELFASFFIPLIGILMIVEQRFWLTIGVINIKILIALVAIALYHISRGKLKNLIAVLESGNSANILAKQYIILRIITLILLAAIFILIVHYKGQISTFYIIKSWWL